MANTKPFVVKNGLQPQSDNDTDIGGVNNKFLNAYISNLEGSVSINNSYTFPSADGFGGTALKTDGNGNLFFGSSGGATVDDNVPAAGGIGDLWFDTGTTGELFIFDGSQWISVNDGPDVFVERTFIADGNTTVFDTQAGSTDTNVIVYLNGILIMSGIDYTYSNGIVTFTQAPLSNDVITAFIIANVQNVNVDTIGLANHDLIIVDALGNITISGDVDMNQNNIIDLADPVDAQDAATKSYVDSAVLAASTPNFGNVRIGVADNQTIDTASGNLVLDGFTNIVSVANDLTVGNDLSISTLGAQGELLLVGANQTVTSSNLLSIDTVNQRIGIGTSTPEVKLHIDGNSAQEAQIRLEQHNNDVDAPDLRIRRSRGTHNVPLILSANDYMFRLNVDVYDGAGYSNVGQMYWDNDGTNDNNGTNSIWGVSTRSAGTTADRISVDANGDVNISGNLDVTGNVTIGGDITIGDVNTDSIVINSDLSSNLVPDLSDTYDLGTASKPWRDLYLTESITFSGATGESEIVVGANLADALSIKDNANDIVVIDTTTGSLSVSINPPTVLGTSLQIGSSITVTDILDEDNMISDSDTALATQQSIKAYVDANSVDPDINFSSDSGSGTVNLATQTLSINGSTNEIVTTATGQTLTIGLPDDVTITNNLTVGGTTTVGNHILPDQNITYDLGSSTARFRDLYLSGTSIDLGGAIITSDGTGVTLPAGSTITGVTLANASSIDELTDVDISTTAPTDGQILVWDNANSKFIPGSPSTPDLSSSTTDDLAEGITNLYYTTARQNTDFDSQLATKTADDLTEGSTNLYYTESRVNSNFSSKTTDDLTEGATNLYYTDARAQTAAQAVSISSVLEDTSPQLGGNLESNGNNIVIDENSRLQFSNASTPVVDMLYQPSDDRLLISSAASGKSIDIYGGSDVELYSVGNLKLGWLGTQSGIYISANAYSTPVYINNLEYPKNDGTNGQVLTTDGSGTLSWTTVSAGSSTDTLADVTARGATTNDAVTINNTLTVTSIDSTGLGFATLESASDISLNAVGDINANNSKITNLATPTASTDAATKSYVDTATAIPFVISSSGSTDYVFSGPAFPVADADPVLYLYRGFTYIFDNTLNGTTHPLEIRVSNGGVAYSAGITGSTTGIQTFTVPMSAPSTLYYQCTVHPGMGNTINIV